MFSIQKKSKKKTVKSALKKEDLSEDEKKLKAFIAEREKGSRRMEDRYETNFWVCLVFNSWDQKQEFLRQVPVKSLFNGMYVDGESFAEQVGKPVKKNAQKGYKTVVQKRLANMVIPSERERAETSFG